MDRTKTFRTMATLALCLMLILVSGFILTACGKTTSKDVYATDHVVDFAGQQFENTTDFKVVSSDGRNFTAQGTLATMTNEQATAWGTTEGARYCIVSIKMEPKAALKTGWVNSENRDTAFGSEVTTKYYNGTEGVKEYVLGISGSNINHSENPIWRIEVTNPVAEGETATTIVYTIDFANLING